MIIELLTKLIETGIIKYVFISSLMSIGLLILGLTFIGPAIESLIVPSFVILTGSFVFMFMTLRSKKKGKK